MVKPITNAKHFARRTSKQRSKNARTPNRPFNETPRKLVTLGTFLPDRVMVKMRYADVKSRAVALAVVDEYQYNLNSTYDPDRTGGGHQPMGRDQLLGTLYNKYRVHSVDVRVTFQPVGGIGYQSILFYAVPSNDLTALTGTLSLAMEQPMSWHFLFGACTVNPANTYKRHFNLWDIWGKTKQEYLSDDITGSSYTSDPVESIVLKLGAMTADATQVVVWQWAIEMDMMVECYDRFSLTQS